MRQVQEEQPFIVSRKEVLIGQSVETAFTSLAVLLLLQQRLKLMVSGFPEVMHKTWLYLATISEVPPLIVAAVH